MRTSENFGKEILNLEKKYWNAMKEQDLETALSLTDFPCLVVGPQGLRSVEKEEFTKMFQSSEGAIQSVEFDEGKTEVRQIGPDTAVIAYQLKSAFTHEGKNKTINAVDTSTWIKRGGKWVCALHTETELQKM